MYIHFTFKDCSNPYFFTGSEEECSLKIIEWARRFWVYPVGKTLSGMFYLLEEMKK